MSTTPATADLTVIILTRNEDKNLPKALESVRGLAKRVVVIDSGSTDRTEEVARAAGADFLHNPWKSYAHQFNWGLANAGITTAWTLRLDADEEVLPELKRELLGRLGALEEGVAGIQVRRRIYFLGRWIRHGDIYPNWVLRVFRTGRGKCEEKLMDEHIVVDGSVLRFAADIMDKNNKPLEWWIAKHNWYSDREMYEVLSMEDLRRQGKIMPARFFGTFAERKRWLKERVYLRVPAGLRAWMYYVYRYYFRLGFLDGPEGRIYHFLQAYWYRFLVDAKLHEAKVCGMDREEIERRIFRPNG